MEYIVNGNPRIIVEVGENPREDFQSFFVIVETSPRWYNKKKKVGLALC